jgi:hypothetical protein
LSFIHITTGGCGGMAKVILPDCKFDKIQNRQYLTEFESCVEQSDEKTAMYLKAFLHELIQSDLAFSISYTLLKNF